MEHCSLTILISEVTKLIPVLITWGLTLVVSLAGQSWHHDYEEARKAAVDQQKDLLVAFTADRDSAWSAQFRAGVLHTAVFEEGVKKQFVLMDVVLPHPETEMEEATRNQNLRLKQDYGPERIPSIYLCDVEGRPYAMTLYWRRGPDSYLEYLDRLRTDRDKRDEAFAASRGAGRKEERAKILEEALAALPLGTLPFFYQKELDELKALDPQSNLLARVAAVVAGRKEARILAPYLEVRDFAGMVKRIDEEIESQKLVGLQRQRFLRHKAKAQAEMKQYDRALGTVMEIYAIDPRSEVGVSMKIFEARMLRLKAVGAPPPSPKPKTPKPGPPKPKTPDPKIPDPKIPDPEMPDLKIPDPGASEKETGESSGSQP
jgi:hypothetical protein